MLESAFRFFRESAQSAQQINLPRGGIRLTATAEFPDPGLKEIG